MDAVYDLPSTTIENVQKNAMWINIVKLEETWSGDIK